MPCRDDFITRENSVGENRILCEMRLERIATMWEDRCEEKYSKWVTEYNRRVEQINKQADHAHYILEKYTRPWLRDVNALAHELHILINKWHAGDAVTTAEWDVVTAGRERKAMHITHGICPLKEWPEPVRGQFPNAIALFMYLWEERIQKRHEKQYAATAEHIANGFTVDTVGKLLQAYYKAQYRKIVKHFADQGAITMELKRRAGDTSDGVGWQTPITAEQIASLREQLEVDQARFEKDVDAMLFDRLRYEDVISGEHIRGDDAARPGAYTYVTPSWWANPHDGCEPDFNVDITHTTEIECEDKLFLPVKPDSSRFAMPLNNSIHDEDEPPLPIEPVFDQRGISLDDDDLHNDGDSLPFDAY